MQENKTKGYKESLEKLKKLKESYSILENFNVGDRVSYINPISNSVSEGEIRKIVFTNESDAESHVIISILDDKTLTNIRVLDPESILCKVDVIL